MREDSIMIRASDISPSADVTLAKMAVMYTAADLGVKCAHSLTMSWRVWVPKSERQAFLDLVREKYREVPFN